MTYYTEKVSDFLSHKYLTYQNILLSRYLLIDKYSKGKPYLRYSLTAFIIAQVLIALFLLESQNFSFFYFLIGNAVLISIVGLGFISVFFTETYRGTIIKVIHSRTNKNTIEVPLNFGLDFNERETKRIYSQFIKYYIINEERTSYNDFVNVFCQKDNDQDSQVHFNTKPGNVDYVISQFKRINPKFNRTTAEESNLFYVNLLPLKATNLSSAKSDNPVSNESKLLIDNIFEPYFTDI